MITQLGYPNKKRLTELMLNNEDCAMNVYLKNPNLYEKMAWFLHATNQRVAIAHAEAKRFADSLEFINCTTEESEKFRLWLSGRTSKMPEKMPSSKRVLFFHRSLNNSWCYMSRVHIFPERLCVYGILKGYVDIVKDPVKLMIENFGVDYAKDFLKRVEIKYNIQKNDIMTMYSLICAGPYKLKLEQAMYLEYIRTWLDEDKEAYQNAISELCREQQKKVNKMLIKQQLV